MEFRYIGRSGLRVSPICLGTMTFGSMCDKKRAFAIMDKAYDHGVNFLDTAEVYPVPPRADHAGITEEIVGDWLLTRPRDSVIIATKVVGAASGWFVPPVRSGLTAIDRHHIIKGVEGSLRRLQCDYIDLYQMHWPDTVVPREESMAAFDELVRSGKVRYLGTSNDTAYGVTKSNMICKYQGLSRFESIQNNFSLLNRRFLDEMVVMCREERISLLPYSPIGGGVLSGKYGGGQPSVGRFNDYGNSDDSRIRAMVNRFVNEKTLSATRRYEQIAKEAGISPVTMAVAWSKQFDFVASTIIGARHPDQLDESLAAMDLDLSAEVLTACDTVHEDIPYPMG